MSRSIYSRFQSEGFCIIRDFCSNADISILKEQLNACGVFDYAFTNADDHNLFKSVAAVHALALSPAFIAAAHSILGNNAQPHYAIMLNKSRSENWGLHWHQDVKIALKERKDTEGFTGWSNEQGICHVVPPIAVLEGLLTMRLHLDDCDDRNGAIWALRGSHTRGLINESAFEDVVKKGEIVPCHTKAGDLMLMSPLLLHKSPYSLSSLPRRVLQIEYRSALLPNGLRWYN